MSVELLPLCKTGKVLNKDGAADIRTANFIPFEGWVYPDGSKYVSNQGEIAQDQSLTNSGNRIPGRFIKTPGVCVSDY